MPGFGSGKFGQGPFGKWDWAYNVIVDSLPESYYQADEVAGGYLVKFLEGLVRPFDKIKERIDTYNDLRDPLKVQTDYQQVYARINWVTNLGDGTSRVFLDEPVVGDVYEKIRPGWFLVDQPVSFESNEFEILEINSSLLDTDVDYAPTDIIRNVPSGKSILVKNIAQSNTEIIPLPSGSESIYENPVTTDNGTNPPPYAFTIAQVPIASAPIKVTYNVASVNKTGYINPDGTLLGDLVNGTSVNFQTGVATINTVGIVDANTLAVEYYAQWLTPTTVILAGSPPTPNYIGYTYNVTPGISIPPGVIRVKWKSGGIDKFGYFEYDENPYGTHRVAHGDLLMSENPTDLSSTVVQVGTYLRLVTSTTIDAGTIRIAFDRGSIKPPHLLEYLASDYGFTLDRELPEYLQRSAVNNIHQLWNLKDTKDGYRVMGALFGKEVLATPLYKVTPDIFFSLPSNQYILGYSELLTLIHGVVPPPYTGTLTQLPVDPNADVYVIWWDLSLTTYYYGWFDINNIPHGDLLPSSTLNRATGAISVDTGITAGAFSPVVVVGGNFYTSIKPSLTLYDDIPADIIPTDTYCWDPTYPTYDLNPITVTSYEYLGYIQGDYWWKVTATTTDPQYVFNTEGAAEGGNFQVYEGYERINSNTFTFTAIGSGPPALGASNIEWNVLFLDLNITSVIDLGEVGTGTGNLYELTFTSASELPLNLDGWQVVDSIMQHLYVEEIITLNQFGGTIRVIAAEPVPTGDASIYYSCELAPSCDFCAASFVKLTVFNGGIMSQEQKYRLERALRKMTAHHVSLVFEYT